MFSYLNLHYLIIVVKLSGESAVLRDNLEATSVKKQSLVKTIVDAIIAERAVGMMNILLTFIPFITLKLFLDFFYDN